MPCVYLTINHYNKDRGIEPYLYSGSDQNDNPEYYGSSEQLKKDIAECGVEHFEKTILHSFNNITNKDLREFESKIQIKEGHKKDPKYYNLTDLCLPGGGKKGMKHSKKFERSQKWIDSMTGKERSDEFKRARSGTGNPMFGRTVKKSTKKIWKEQGRGVGAKNGNSLLWEINTPEGETFTVTSLKNWCKENDIDYGRVYHQRCGYTHVKHGNGKGGRPKNVRFK